MYAITLGGMSGGGARDIGPLVAQKLEADYVDRIFLSNIAKACLLYTSPSPPD